MLHRPAPAAAFPLAELRSPWVVVEEGRVATAQGTFAISPWVPGVDVDGLLAAGASPAAVAAVVGEVIAALADARTVGVAHGALDGSVVRVGPRGEVVVLGFRGGGADDLATLWDLATSWMEAVGGPTDLGPAPATLADASARIAAWGPSSGASLAEIASAADHAPTLHDHPLRGVVLREDASAPIPPKVRIAGTAAVTLLLGLLAGALLAGGGVVETARERAVVRCGAGVVEVHGRDLAVRADGCE